MFTPSEDVMREAEPDLVEWEPVSMESDEVEDSVLSCAGMGGD